MYRLYRPSLWLLLVLLLLSACRVAEHPSSPKDTVTTFFQQEQAGNFGSSWELLHPELQERWSKEQYIQQRSRFLMEEMGAKTFDFALGEVQSLPDWSSPLTGAIYEGIQLIPTKMTFHSKWGAQTLLQNYYLVQVDGQWRILWDVVAGVD